MLLFTLLGFVFSRIRRELERAVLERFDKRQIIAATTRANFFGLKSKSGWQLRGNGALVLTGEVLWFLRAVPRKEYQIPIRSVRQVSTPRVFNGKSALVPLLCVTYGTGGGEDAIGWAVRDPGAWKAAIEELMSRSATDR
jgi:hypothetical protein